MKNYNEMANNVFERRDRYETNKKNKRKILIRTLTPICCFCLVMLLDIGLWQGGVLNTTPPQTATDSVIPGEKDCYGPDDIENQTSSDNNYEGNDVQYITGDLLGMIVYEGKTYSQNTEMSIDDIVLKEKIGTGEDFDGTYNSQWLKRKYEETGNVCYNGGTLKSEIYTVVNNDNLLCAVLENGGYIILQYGK